MLALEKCSGDITSNDEICSGMLLLFMSMLLSSHPDKFPATPPGDDVADKVVEPELDELASSRLSGRGGGEAGLPIVINNVRQRIVTSSIGSGTTAKC